MLRRACLLLCTASLGCEGLVGELGAAGEVPLPPDPDAPFIELFACTPATGFAPRTAQCRLKAADPEGQVVRCQVLVREGLAPVELPECRVEQTFEVTLPDVGTYALRAQAVDVDGQVALRTLELEATLRPNEPPVIDTFAASPSGGAIPFSTTLGWTAHDADGDALSCEVDVGDDGTVDGTVPGCATGQLPWTLTAAGTVRVRLRVNDGHGGTAEATLELSARLVTGEVGITRVEYMQTVVKESLRLVAAKPFTLRVHAIADRPGLQNVRFEGQALRGGAPLGSLTFTGPATPPTAAAPADLSQQYVAEVPAAWVQPGLELRLKLDAADAVAETDELNNLRTLTPTIGEDNVFELTAVPVVHQGTTAGTPATDAIMQRLWPISRVNTQVRTPYTWSGALSGGDGNAWADLLQDISTARQTDGSRRQYYGWVKVSYGSGIAGIGYIGQPAATGRDDSLSTFAHEKGHNMGRPHAPCGGAAGSDPNYPYAGASIGTWGWDAVGKRLLNPASGYKDLMSYCDPEWVSDYNYQRVQTFLEAQPDVSGAPAPFQLSVVVAGAFRQGRVVLKPVHRAWAPPSPVVDGPYALRLVGDDGRELRVPFETWVVEDGGEAAGEQHFSLVVPFERSIALLEVLDGDRVLWQRARLPIAAPPPVLERLDATTLRVAWSAASHPSAAVSFLSPEGRTTLALDLRGGEALVKTDGLPLQGDFELSLSDGVDAVRRLVQLR